MVDARRNFAYSTVATAPSPATTGTSVTVATGTGAAFPAPPFNVTVWPAGSQPTNANAGIMRVTAVAGDVFTVLRAQEGAIARAVVVGDQIAATITAKMLADLDIMTELGRNLIGVWLPVGNTGVAPATIGLPAISTVGTATARNVVTTNFFTRTKRIGYVSVATAAGFAGARLASAQMTLGAAVTQSGFRTIVRFGASDGAAVAGARQFVGVSSSVVLPTNVEPSTLLNSIGVGHGTADTNLFLYFGGSTAQAPINLGANFPANTLSVDMYELELSSPVATATIDWRVTRLNTGQTTAGTIAAGTAGVTLPANTTLLSPMQAWRCNNATALAVGLDFSSLYTGPG